MLKKIMGMDKTIIAFILLALFILTNPKMVNDLNNHLIGKVIIISLIIYFTNYSLVLGLLCVFIYFMILDNYKYIIEGLETQQPENKNLLTEEQKNKIKEQHITTENTVGSIPEEKKINISTNNQTGIDREDIKNSIASKDSNTLPINKNMFSSGDNVEPFYVK